MELHEVLLGSLKIPDSQSDLHGDDTNDSRIDNTHLPNYYISSSSRHNAAWKDGE